MPAEREILDNTFRTVGTDFGFEDIDAQFAGFKEFKSTWTRCGRKISFQISDYLSDAGPVVLEDFARSLYSRLARQGDGGLYGPCLKEYLSSDAFLERNQPLYLKRSRNLSRTARGERYDLKETYENLVRQGMVSGSPHASLNWTVKENRMRVGYCSVIMHVVAISSLLDNENVPEHVHEYVLYHELLHLEEGLSNGHRHHTSEFRAREHQYPKWRESEDWLRRLAARKIDLT